MKYYVTDFYLDRGYNAGGDDARPFKRRRDNDGVWVAVFEDGEIMEYRATTYKLFDSFVEQKIFVETSPWPKIKRKVG